MVEATTNVEVRYELTGAGERLAAGRARCRQRDGVRDGSPDRRRCSDPGRSTRSADPVGLPELDESAALLTRRDRKYIVPTGPRYSSWRHSGTLPRPGGGRPPPLPLRVGLLRHPRARLLPGCCVPAAASFKVRTRTYLDTGRACSRSRRATHVGRTVKERYDHPFGSRDHLELPDVEVLRACPVIGDHAGALEPVLTTRYARATLLIDGGGVRATLDTDVRAIARDGNIAALPGIAIIESKSVGPPSEVDRVLWSMGYRPTRVSKFCTSLAALFPDLPANKWTRALRQPWSVARNGDRLDLASRQPCMSAPRSGSRCARARGRSSPRARNPHDRMPGAR